MMETFVLLYVLLCTLTSCNSRTITFLLRFTNTRDTPHNRIDMVWLVWLCGLIVTFVLAVLGLLIGRAIIFWMNYF